MFVRALTLAGGLAGAAGLSQFPEYSQQYTQRLAGKVEELTRFVNSFDEDAAAVGVSREDALAALAESSAIGEERARTMKATMERQSRLAAALSDLRDAGPFTRAYRVGAFTDAELARGTMSDFKPAVPLTFEGLVFAVIGFLAGLGVFSLLTRIAAQLLGRRRHVA